MALNLIRKQIQPWYQQLLALGVTSEQLSPKSIKSEVKPPSQWAGIVSGALYILPVHLYGRCFMVYFPSGAGQ